MHLSHEKKPARLQELTRWIDRYTTAHAGANPFITAIEGFTILRSEQARQPSHRIYRPALCITLQGAKWAAFGDKRFVYRAGQALVVSVEMPSRGSVSAASPTEPFLGLVVEFDRAILQDVMEELGMHLKPSGSERARGAFVIDMTSPLVDCALRAVRLLEIPKAIPALYPGILRELCYWLLTGPGGDQIVHMTLTHGQERRVFEAIHHLRDRFTEAIRIDDLAVTAGMSTSTFHRQFKSVTSMTPLQYQKQLRLLEARRLMLTSNTSVETAAFQVGYESASQFSREYSRIFGKSPRRDITAMQTTETRSRRSA